MRAHFRLFIEIGALPAGVVAAIYGVVMGLAFLTTPYVHQPIGAPGIAVIAVDCLAGLLGLAALLLTFALFEPAASYTALQLDAGRTVTFREAYGAAWSKAGRYFWLLILRQLLVSGPMVAPVLVFCLISVGMVLDGGHAISANNLPILGILLLFLAIVLYLAAVVWAVLATIRLVLAYPACVAENLTAWEAVRRGNRLSQGGRLRIFLVGLVLYAASYGVILACELAFGIVFGIGAIPVYVFHLGPAWTITGIILLGICSSCVLLLLVMCISSAYSVAFAILYREHLRLEAASALPGAAG